MGGDSGKPNGAHIITNNVWTTHPTGSIVNSMVAIAATVDNGMREQRDLRLEGTQKR